MRRWAAVPLAIGAVSLLNSLVGLAWDIAYHIDHGRDSRLFTVPHLMTLSGLAGFGLAGTLAAVLAVRAGRPVPRAAPVIIVMSAASTIGFPLDDLWHRVYGVDVTLWSPTHLVMIGGAILSTFAFALLAAEGQGGRLRRDWVGVMVMAAPLLGLSVLQFEFDFGVPQWQALMQPVLIAGTAGVALVAARLALGGGGAVAVAAVFLAFRGLLAILIAALGHTVPASPLYLGAAFAVELAFAFERRLTSPGAVVVAGLLVGSAGVATEWLWTQAVSPLPWQPALLPRLPDALLAAIGASICGLGAGSVLAGRAPARSLLVAGGAIVLAIALVLPLPRAGATGTAVIRAQPAGAPRAAVDRFGRPGEVQPVTLDIDLRPDAAAGADWAVAMAWQGGGREVVPLRRGSGGTYRTTRPIDTGSGWKTMVYVARGGELAAAPVAFPSDPEYGAPGVPLVPERTEPLAAAPELLMSEAHSARSWVATASYAALWTTTAAWLLLLAWAYRADAGGAPLRPAAPRRAAA